MLFKEALDKIKRFLPKRKKVSRKRLLIFVIPAILVFLLLTYEGFIYAWTLYVVGKGDDYFKVDKLTEALAKYQEGASIWSKSILLRRVKGSPASWRIAKTEKSIADLPKALTPEIEVVSWEAKNVSCQNLRCHEISLKPQIVDPAYAACGDWTSCEAKVTIFKAVLKNKGVFPAFFMKASLDYKTASGNTTSYEILKPTDLTYIPPNGEYIIQRVLAVAPKETIPEFNVEGIAYYENSNLYNGFHNLEVVSFEIFKKYGYPNFRIALRNGTEKVLDRIGFETIFEPLGKWAPYYGTAIPLDYGEASSYPLTKEVEDETAPGRPVVRKPISLSPGETAIVENSLNLRTTMGTPDFFVGLGKIVYLRAFGLEKY